MMKVIGIDLAGREKNPSGLAIIEINEKNEKIFAKEVYSDVEILRNAEKIKPNIIAIDSPFSIPETKWRRSDEELLKEGFRPLSPKFPTMQLLVRRAMRLIASLRKNYKVIEVFPRATEKILVLEKTSIESKLGRSLTEHEYDAILAAITGKMHLEGNTRTLGSSDDENDQVVVPI